MRRRLWLFLALAGCAPPGDAPLIGADPIVVGAGPESEVEVAPSSYFPPALARTPGACDRKGVEKPMPVLGEFQQGWYSRHLEAAGEPSLFALSERPRPAGPETIRFTWLRSFHAPVIVRVERDDAGRLRMVAKQLSGAGGYRPGTVERRVERDLTNAETKRLREAFVHNRLFDLPPKECDLGLDGAQWIFEAVDSEGYHFLDRWSPSSGPVREMGELLLGLTGWKPKPIY